MSDVGPPRGILRHPPAPGRFHHARIASPDALADLVQHFWIVRWDLQGGPPQVRETLPHPNVHLVVEDGQALLNGIHGGRFVAELRGRGGVLGIKFRAGACRPLLGRSVSTLRNRSLPVEEAFGVDAAAFVRDVADAGEDDDRLAAAATDFLLGIRPPPDPTAQRAAELVAAIERDPGLTRVEQLAERSGTTPRTLQRLFNEYVGIGPKWVINRYRLHEAIERLARGGPADWAGLALDLGYFDQAHFIRDFHALVGRSPGDYVRTPQDALDDTSEVTASPRR
jgi:AraC-like DNA-binding protein